MMLLHLLSEIFGRIQAVWTILWLTDEQMDELERRYNEYQKDKE